jgi:hypothetical protein
MVNTANTPITAGSPSHQVCQYNIEIRHWLPCGIIMSQSNEGCYNRYP